MEDKLINDDAVEELCSPLVVHKKGDASYGENTVSIDVNETHENENEMPTLKRHRFRKEKNKNGNKALIVIAVLFVIIAAVFCALYFTGNISFDEKVAKTTKQTTTQQTTSLQEKYANTIVIKGTFIFVNGVEVDGIKGLQDALEYEDKSTTAYSIINENANDSFVNYNVLPLLSDMGFYDENTVVTHQGYTGLIAKAEETTNKA